MRSRSGQVAVAAIAFVLGLLVVVQLRSQQTGSTLDTLSAQDLTQLVANLTARNDQLRTEVGSLEAQRSQLETSANRGESAAGQLRADLGRIRAWAGLDAATGPGVIVTVRGPIAAQGIADLLNELRNAGAEAIQVADVRIVAGSIVAGEPGALSIDNSALGDPIAVLAIGNPVTLTGSLTRPGGPIAQIVATYPGTDLTVSRMDTLRVLATERDLAPGHGSPRL